MAISSEERMLVTLRASASEIDFWERWMWMAAPTPTASGTRLIAMIGAEMRKIILAFMQPSVVDPCGTRLDQVDPRRISEANVVPSLLLRWRIVYSESACPVQRDHYVGCIPDFARRPEFWRIPLQLDVAEFARIPTCVRADTSIHLVTRRRFGNQSCAARA